MKKTFTKEYDEELKSNYYYENYPISDLYKIAVKILKPEKSFYYASVVYGIAISLLSLAIPVSVQTLITTVANTAITNQVVVLAMMLFTVLCLSGLFNALQVYAMELFERKFFARISSEITLQNVYAEPIEFKSTNRVELINRYFDIMTVQKNLPTLLIGGGSLALQSIVGLVLVSSYHYNLALFNIFFLICLYLTWKIWKSLAIRSALALSNAKYKVAYWHEEMAKANNDFKCSTGAIYGIERSEYLTRKYMDKRSTHFKYKFYQIIGLLVIYAVFSSLLLGIGGVLVIEGQLTLGQLVASELILAAVFFGFSQASTYLKLFYDLIPAVEKISHFHKIKTEIVKGYNFEKLSDYSIKFDKIKCEYRDIHVNLDLEIKHNDKVMVGVQSDTIKNYFIELLQNYRSPCAGAVYIGNNDISEFDQHSYRNFVRSIDDPYVLEGPIECYLKILNPEANISDINKILRLVKLDKIVSNLPDKLETKLFSLGYPLSSSETLRLKLASTLLGKPKILILTELFDLVGYEIRRDIMQELCQMDDLTLIYFSNRRDISTFSKYMHINFDQHILSDNISLFDQIDRQGDF